MACVFSKYEVSFLGSCTGGYVFTVRVAQQELVSEGSGVDLSLDSE